MNETLELRSDDVEEIMSQIPPWIQRWGLTVLFGILMIFFIICCILRFPQTITADVVLTSSTPPVELHANVTGNFSYMGVFDKQIVKKGDILAVLNNPANIKDVICVKELYGQWKEGEISLESLIEFYDEKKWQLGELQSCFMEFRFNAENYCNYKKRDYYLQKIALKKKEQHTRQELAEVQSFQSYIALEQANVERRIFIRDSILFDKQLGSEDEYDQALKSYLQSRKIIHDYTREKKEMVLLEIENRSIELDLLNQYAESLASHIQTLYFSAENMETQIEEWEHTYVLKSPIDGIVNLVGLWNKNQYVVNGDLVFIVLPVNPNSPLGKAWLPASGIGNVQVGQKVNVSLSNYPDYEYGFLTGKIQSISSIPNESHLYYVNIEFPNGLITNRKKVLPPSKQMIGTAKIIIDEERLIEKILQPISNLFN